MTSMRMRFFVIKDFSPARRTSMRKVFMLTSVMSCTIGSTNAPPPITAFSPPQPVRTKDRSFEEWRYSQCSRYTATAMTIASKMMTAMMSAPFILYSSKSLEFDSCFARCKANSIQALETLDSRIPTVRITSPNAIWFTRSARL